MQSPNLVTASVDRIQQTHRANLKDDMTISGSVSWVGRSAVEVTMQATSSWTDEPWLMGIFTYVARDIETGKAVPVPLLKPETEVEDALFQAGAARAANRKLLTETDDSGAKASLAPSRTRSGTSRPGRTCCAR